jgi:molybdopterin converting factor small subunit
VSRRSWGGAEFVAGIRNPDDGTGEAKIAKGQVYPLRPFPFFHFERGGWVHVVDVHLDSWLREFGPRTSEKVEADSIERLLDTLEKRYPRLRFKIRDETGHLRRHVRVFVDGEDVSGTTGVGTRLSGSQTIDILHSIAGG